MNKRLLSLILTGIFAAMPLVSCGSEPKGATDDTETSAAATEETTQAAETSGVPDSLDLGGEVINIWYTTKATSVAETFVDIAGELTGDILDDAIFNMNKKVETKLNCELNYYNSGTPTSDTGSVVQKLLLADDTTYDLYHVVQWNAAKFAADGLYLNIADAPYLSLDKPWWDNNYMKEMTIGEDTLYALVGDYAVDRTRCLDCIYYNKSLFDNYYKDPNGLYQEVIDGKWTWDRLSQISTDVWTDINGDGIEDWDDQLGYCINNYNNLDGLFYGTGARVTARDKDDHPTLVANTERISDITESLYKLVYETDGAYMYGAEYTDDVKARDKFAEGTSMFLFGFFYTAEAMRDMTADYGIVPVPKYDEEQKDYVSIVHDIMRIMVLPANCQKVDSVCAVLEELSFNGYQDVLPAYYDVLMKNKYARDDVSASMIDIIRDNCSPDIAYIYGDPFNGMGYIYRNLIQGKSSNFASEYAKRESSALTKMAEFIEKFTSIGQ